jgi:L-ascorbate metabolism protein UlaG (beta-lactamase superfamily)
MNKFNLNYFILFFSFIILSIFFDVNSMGQTNDPVLKIHYLGHSSFLLQFDNGVNIVTDYGHYNAWVEWGWDSPIHDIGELVPDVMTYSHFHEDHYDPDRIPEGVQHILSEFDSLIINGIEIKPIRVCENNINNEDNSAYLFTYKGQKFLHLGDAQSQIMNINNESVSSQIKHIIPDSLDILFMTIDGPQQFMEEAELFVDLLKPRRIIPMHDWTIGYKKEFLMHLAMQNNYGKHYDITQLSIAKYDIYENDFPAPVKVVSLTRSPFTDVTSVKKNNLTPLEFNLNQNYPNPFNPTTNIRFTLPSSSFTKLEIFDSLGQLVNTIISHNLNAGEYSMSWNSTNQTGKYVSSGIYIYRLTTNKSSFSNKMVLLR